MNRVDKSESETFSMAHFLPYRLALLARKVGESFAKTYEAEFGINNHQWRIIHSLANNPGASSSIILREATLDKVQMSRALVGLIEQGLVDKAHDRSDRRAHRLHLTRKGRGLYDRIVPLALGFEKQLKAGLSAEESKVLDQIINRLLGAVEEG